jgi:aspartate kinase
MGIKVFKFGGASVKDAQAVSNVARILKNYSKEEVLVVISAMGKTTNLLEDLTLAYINNLPERFDIMNKVKEFHHAITKELIGESAIQFYEVDNLLIELECMIETQPDYKEYDKIYDQIVPFGELISTRIISHYLNLQGLTSRWVDARNFIMTNQDYRRARIKWDTTADLIETKLKPLVKRQIVITQGFIGKNEQHLSTTLGREGSDYSASIFAFGLNAESVTIWKDVPGVMNADPKRIEEATMLPEISFLEAIELAYYGATVIHPKTIQPIKSKNIPLYVKSFVNPEEKGTTISNYANDVITKPCYIFKDNQVLISLSSRDLSFIIEDNLSNIFSLLAAHRTQVNLMQNSAISFSFCANYEERNFDTLIQDLERDYAIEITKELQLITIFNYKSEQNALNKVLQGRDVILEQLSSKVIQLVVKQ